MPRKSNDTLNQQLFASQRRAMALGTDPEWQVNNRAALELDLRDIQAAYVVAVRVRGQNAKRLANFRSASVIYRARYTPETLLLFCNDPIGLTSQLTPAARNDGLDILVTYGLFDGTPNSIPTGWTIG
mgnify:CR=1 FL=1